VVLVFTLRARCRAQGSQDSFGMAKVTCRETTLAPIMNRPSLCHRDHRAHRECPAEPGTSSSKMLCQDAVDKGVSPSILDHMKAVTLPPLSFQWKSRPHRTSYQHL
jgi:hypothetical protein